jgi:SPP1 family holin
MDKQSVARYIVLVVAVLNAVLNLFGYQTISDDLTNDLVAVVSGVIFLYVAWKNNYLSKRGQSQKQRLKDVGLD